MTTFDRQRAWVNNQFGDLARGRPLGIKQRTRLLRKLWKKAKKEVR